VTRHDSIDAADLVVRAALTEYQCLRAEILHTFQQMQAVTTLGLAIAGAVASLVFSQHLGDIEVAVLLVGTALILMDGVAVVAMSLHISTITRWLQHVSTTHIHKAIAAGAGPLVEVPDDLLGWDDYLAADRSGRRITGGFLRRIAWLALIPLPSAALVFEARAALDVAANVQIVTPVVAGLIAVDALGSVGAAIYALLVLRQVKALRSSDIPPKIVRAS
jgi:hypothetical protein